MFPPGEKKGGRRAEPSVGPLHVGQLHQAVPLMTALPSLPYPLLLSTPKIRFWIFQVLLFLVPSSALETELYLQGWVILGLEKKRWEVPET